MLSSNRPSMPRSPNAHGLRADVLRNSTRKSPNGTSPLSNRRSTGEENAGTITRRHEQPAPNTRTRKTNKPPLQRKLSPFPDSLAGKLANLEQTVGLSASLDEGAPPVSNKNAQATGDSSMLVLPQRPSSQTPPRSRRDMLRAICRQQHQQGCSLKASKSPRFSPQMSAIEEASASTETETKE